MPDEKCPNCSSQEYEVDNFWDNFDEDGGIRVWECFCPSCQKRFSIACEYNCTRTFVEVSES